MEFGKPYQITPSSKHHFFGYYSICPWSENQKYFLSMEVNFHDHMPKFGEKARILLMNLENGKNKIIASTNAWNFQQGSMMHWMPKSPNDEVIFNDTDGQKIFSRVLNVHSQEERQLPRGINAMAHTKNEALCASFSRLRKNRKVCSYPCRPSKSKSRHPSEDGIWIMNTDNGKERLVISLNDIWELNPHTRNMPKIKQFGRDLWFNHLGFNPDDSRIFFLARYHGWSGKLVSSMWTCKPDGSDPYLLVDFGHRLSHFEWRDNEELILTMILPQESKRRHIRVRDKTQDYTTIAGDKLIFNGHITMNPRGRYFATDTYPKLRKRYLYIVDMAENPEEVTNLAVFPAHKIPNPNLRCDMHPRWNRTGNKLCFDGLGENGRQIYAIDFKFDD